MVFLRNRICCFSDCGLEKGLPEDGRPSGRNPQGVMIFDSNLIGSADVNITEHAMINNLSGRLESGLEI